ncbi:MAG TPA: cobalamin-independent methionine synthase II family protein [Candidatus Binataceae bacterium]|jgi:5-methyltetrahydropteroyltriglutamate--homocysteine methyltransferase|nr:cobalamin-independent methionine synthase II family protein [Candidatus Binataceae bacterium]
MANSDKRILTTHTGSLPRPAELMPVIEQREQGTLTDQAGFEARVAAAVDEIVRKQVEAGVDVVNDGEVSKISYSTYVKDRLTGFEGEGLLSASGLALADFREFPELAARLFENAGMARTKAPACDGPIKYKSLREVQTDVANLKAAVSGANIQGAFMSAASPGVISGFLPNHYYKTPEAYVGALADAMKAEYEAIHQGGFILQLDCPDLAMSRHIWFPEMSLADFRKRISMHVEALNHAVASIPPERMRMHLCWGNYEGPHHLDVPLADIIDIVLKARPAMISLEAANPRHEHEWEVFEKVKLPEGKTLIPGMLDSTTNFVEHPQLIAQRLMRWGSVVGRDNLMAGTDCGFATFAGMTPVYPGVVWLKFKAMAEGCKIASAKLWG